MILVQVITVGGDYTPLPLEMVDGGNTATYSPWVNPALLVDAWWLSVQAFA
jgi:hypothetical protein